MQNERYDVAMQNGEFYQLTFKACTYQNFDIYFDHYMHTQFDIYVFN
jgi:hypothetical protein